VRISSGKYSQVKRLPCRKVSYSQAKMAPDTGRIRRPVKQSLRWRSELFVGARFDTFVRGMHGIGLGSSLPDKFRNFLGTMFGAFEFDFVRVAVAPDNIDRDM
jgi:hypothetical protein